MAKRPCTRETARSLLETLEGQLRFRREARRFVQAALALDRQTGRAIWRRDILRNHTNKIFVGNDSATPTPTSDGETIYAFFPDLGLISFNAAGEERWRIKLGPFDSFYGLLIVACRRGQYGCLGL